MKYIPYKKKAVSCTDNHQSAITAKNIYYVIKTCSAILTDIRVRLLLYLEDIIIVTSSAGCESFSTCIIDTAILFSSLALDIWL